jgi:hypothetical protein
MLEQATEEKMLMTPTRTVEIVQVLTGYYSLNYCYEK